VTTVKWLKLNFDEEDVSSVTDLLNSQSTICGFSEVVDQFEEACSAYFGVKHALACANGTVAIFIACEALQRFYDKKFNYGVPTWSYIAPANVADYVGELTLIDSEINSHNVEVNNVDLGVVDALIPVDMAGIPVDYDSIKKLNIPVVADCAESLGSKYKGEHSCSLSLVSTTSFQDAKIITTGEGGMVFTNNDEIAKICKLLINQGYGPSGYDMHDHIAKGFNFRMSALQAALGISQLKKIEKFLSLRENTASIYREKLNKLVEFPIISEDVISNNYSFLIMLDSKTERDKLKNFLASKNIQSKLWKPIHLYGLFKDQGSFTNAEYIFDHHLRLPIHNNMRDEETELVCREIKKCLEVIRND